ncbi:MAG: D-2-hydroxyacid dehydrogenase [Acidimicrobiales bacterium]
MHVVSLTPLSPEAQRQIEAVDPSVTLTMAPGWFDGEIRETWGDHVADAYQRPGSTGVGTTEERTELLSTAEVILVGFPVPIDLRARSPHLRWVHQTPAGANNLHNCDIWGSDVVVSTSRGLGNTLAIAEYVIASFLHFGRDLHRAQDDRQHGKFRRGQYRPTLLAGQTACVVGAGGIGAEVGRLAAALGMRVVGTRRSVQDSLPEGFAHIGPPDELHELLTQSRFVAVCCQLTAETTGLIGAAELAAMPDDAVLVNVARGEVVDTDALTAGLDRLRGVALDVYTGEMEHPPSTGLWQHEKVLITPHTSGGAEVRPGRPVELFCRNLAALISGDEQDNVIDWQRGY